MGPLEGIAAALGPVFALVLLGNLFRRLDFPGQAFWPLAERFTYFLLFPSLLVYKLSTTALVGDQLWTAASAVLLTLMVASVGALIWGRLSGLTGAAQTSFFQGGVRFNTYVGLAAAAALYGESGILWGAVFIAVTVPVVNVLCVALFAVIGRSERALSFGGLLLTLVKNPLILACVLGISLNLSGLGLPWGVTPVLELFSRMALPLGLLAVGVGLDFRALSAGGRALWGACFYKLVVYPLIFIGVSRGLGLAPDAVSVLLIFALLPTAPSAYILARQLGGDAPLMAAIITLQTLLAMVTMPLALMLVR